MGGSSGPRFLRFFVPVIEALREVGGEAPPREVIDRVQDLAGIDDDERAERTSSGSLRVHNQIHWARNYLVWAGLIDGSKRGRWALTADGWSLDTAQLDAAAALALFKKVRADHADEWTGSTIDQRGGTSDAGSASGDEGDEVVDDDDQVSPIDTAETVESDLVTSLRTTVLALPPAGFETLCKRVLTELGLVQLRNVGGSGDRGIDIEGQIRVNSVITFRVGVQCKLYSDGNKVTPRQIRELQGALGPFDRGIFMTTSVFTQQAEDQASAPGYKPIDLIDGERLIELLIRHELGTRTVTVVNSEFFEPFRRQS